MLLTKQDICKNIMKNNKWVRWNSFSFMIRSIIYIIICTGLEYVLHYSTTQTAQFFAS